MQKFFEDNWLSIMSIFVGIIVAYVFYRLQRKDSISASVERKKHANVELLDVIESYLINKQELTESVIENLIFASERSHTVALRPGCTAISLLQDAALRLQRSRHLDIPQKTEYSEKIDALIADLFSKREPLRWDRLSVEFVKTRNEIEALVPDQDRSGVRQKLDTLREILEGQQKAMTAEDESTGSAFAMVTALIVGGAASYMYSSIGRIFENPIFHNQADTISMVLQGTSGVLAIVIAISCWRLFRR